jgi:predicted MPP superfamily phosphohydrolase
MVFSPRHPLPTVSRRTAMMAAVGCLLPATAALGWANIVEPHWLSVSFHPLSIRGLPTLWQGKRLVHISDLHIGRVDREFLVKALHQVNDLRPDLLVVTGDFIDSAYPAAVAEVADILDTLRPATIASLACLGNHDYGPSRRDLDLADAVAAATEKARINVLRNQSLELDGLEVIGLDDFWSPRYRAKPSLERAQAGRPAICLCHNPDVCDQPVWGDFQGVILAGHTHGGQCRPPYFRPPILPVRNKNYVEGFHSVGHERTLYINRGLGYTLRVRFNCRPEISVFEMLAS